MFSDFRRIFKPTKEEQRQDLELFLKMHTNNIGRCCTCIHKIESHAPGFVTDDGSCDVKSPVFFKKVCAIGEEPECPQYEEDTEYPKTLKQQIELLDVKYPLLNDSFPNTEKNAIDEFKEYSKTKVKEFDEMIFNELKKYGIEDLKDFTRVQAIPQMTRNEGIEVESKWYVDGEHVFDLCKRTHIMYRTETALEVKVEYFIRKDK